jgi:hypothetical protein
MMGMLFNYPKPAAAMTLMDYNPTLAAAITSMDDNLMTSRLPVVTTALRADRKSVPTSTRRKSLKESVPARTQVLELTSHQQHLTVALRWLSSSQPWA